MSVAVALDFQFRYYDSHSGRFLQEDPHPGRLDASMTITNKYIYAVNNPVLYADPSGEFVLELLIGSLVAGAVSAMLQAAVTKAPFFEVLFSAAGAKAFAIGFAGTFASGLAGGIAATVALDMGVSATGALVWGGLAGGAVGSVFNISLLGQGASSSEVLFAGILGFAGGALAGFGGAGMRVNEVNRGLIPGAPAYVPSGNGPSAPTSSGPEAGSGGQAGKPYCMDFGTDIWCLP